MKRNAERSAIRKRFLYTLSKAVMKVTVYNDKK